MIHLKKNKENTSHSVVIQTLYNFYFVEINVLKYDGNIIIDQIYQGTYFFPSHMYLPVML